MVFRGEHDRRSDQASLVIFPSRAPTFRSCSSKTHLVFQGFGARRPTRINASPASGLLAHSALMRPLTTMSPAGQFIFLQRRSAI
jgi:hypothetical protein